MRMAVAFLNVALGLVYTSYGVMTVIELRQGWQSRGVSHFGMAWVAMAFTCGPHHLDHGVHAFLGRAGGPLDVLAVVVGVPAGVTWFLLRLEAVAGGRGDRFIAGTPDWIALLPAVAGVYFALLVAAVNASNIPVRFTAVTVPNLLLVVIYCAIGASLLRTQLANRPRSGGWSLSGLSLTVVFPTCALMHGIYAMYGMTGRYAADLHGLMIDWLAVPAGLYFLDVVHRLSSGRLADWNRGVGDASPVATRVAADV